MDYVSADVCQAQLELLKAANKQVSAAEDEVATANRARLTAEWRAHALEEELAEAFAIISAAGLGHRDKDGRLSIEEAERVHRERERELERLKASGKKLEREVEILRRECEMRRSALVNARHCEPTVLQATPSAQELPRVHQGSVA